MSRKPTRSAATSAATSTIHLPFNFVYLQHLFEFQFVDDSLGISVPTLFGFFGPIFGLRESLATPLRESLATPTGLVLTLGTSTAFRDRPIYTKPAYCLRIALRLRRQLLGTALNQLCVSPARCFGTHFLARSFQLPLSFNTNTRAHTTTRALRTTRPVIGSTDRCRAQY